LEKKGASNFPNILKGEKKKGQKPPRGEGTRALASK